MFFFLFFFNLLLCDKFSIAENYALFGVTVFTLKLGWCKENDIFHVCCTALHLTSLVFMPHYTSVLYIKLHRKVCVVLHYNALHNAMHCTRMHCTGLSCREIMGELFYRRGHTQYIVNTEYNIKHTTQYQI